MHGRLELTADNRQTDTVTGTHTDRHKRYVKTMVL